MLPIVQSIDHQYSSFIDRQQVLGLQAIVIFFFDKF